MSSCSGLFTKSSVSIFPNLFMEGQMNTRVFLLMIFRHTTVCAFFCPSTKRLRKTIADWQWTMLRQHFLDVFQISTNVQRTPPVPTHARIFQGRLSASVNMDMNFKKMGYHAKVRDKKF